VFFEEIPNLAAGITEIFAHPVQDGEELRGYDTRNAEIRIHDAACLTDPVVYDFLMVHEIRLVSFREIREVQRCRK